MSASAVDKPVTQAWVPTEVPPQMTEVAIKAILADLLDEGEVIIWSAQPDAGSIRELESAKARGWWAPVLVGGGFLLFIAWSILSRFSFYAKDPSNLVNFWMPAVIGVVTMGIGVACFFSPRTSSTQAKYTLYAITNKRAITFEPAEIPRSTAKEMRWKFTAVTRDALRDVQVRQIPGREDIRDILWSFSQPRHDYEKVAVGREQIVVEATVSTGFYGVPIDSDVEELLRRLRAS